MDVQERESQISKRSGKKQDESVINQGDDQQLTPKIIEETTPMLFNIIYSVFSKDGPKATIKIGLIYLAKIMDFYPDFTQKYLEVLL